MWNQFLQNPVCQFGYKNAHAYRDFDFIAKCNYESRVLKHLNTDEKPASK